MNTRFASIDVVVESSIRWPLAHWVELSELLRRIPRTATLRGFSAVGYRWWGMAASAESSASRDKAEAAESDQSTAIDSADIRASLDGYGQAYARLVRRYQDPIGAYMWRFTRDRRQRDELVQDVFVDAYFSLATYAGRAPLIHWLKRIATRVGYRYWKDRQRRRREAPLPEDADQVTAVSDGTESARHAAEVVHRLLARLAPRDRLVMTLTYLEERNVSEVAQLTGWTETMVKVQAHRARKRLAKICEQVGIEP